MVKVPDYCLMLVCIQLLVAVRQSSR